MKPRQLLKTWIGKTVELCSDVETIRGTRYAAGTVFEVASTHRGRFTLSRPAPDRPGFVDVIRQVRQSSFREV